MLRKVLEEGAGEQQYIETVPRRNPCRAWGQKRGLFWLTKAYQARDPQLIWIRLDPQLESLHTDPRFSDLLRRMNLVQ